MTPKPGDRYEHVPTGGRYTFRDTWFSYARLVPDGSTTEEELKWVLLPYLRDSKLWRREEPNLD